MRLLRDEVLAEWQLDGPSPTLHVHCHVSGQERWLAPPLLRNYIFKREMALVRRNHWPAQSRPSHVRFVCIACLERAFCPTVCASLPVMSARVSSCTRSCITSAVPKIHSCSTLRHVAVGICCRCWTRSRTRRGTCWRRCLPSSTHQCSSTSSQMWRCEHIHAAGFKPERPPVIC